MRCTEGCPITCVDTKPPAAFEDANERLREAVVVTCRLVVLR